jgi:hypothetical protein
MTTQTLRKDDGHAKHNSQTTPAERIAIRTAPELKDNDSRNAFTRHLAHHELQTSTLSTCREQAIALIDLSMSVTAMLQQLGHCLNGSRLTISSG